MYPTRFHSLPQLIFMKANYTFYPGFFFSLCYLLLTLNVASAQTIRYVKPTATGNGSGTSWANASDNLQSMISASVTNDQIWVAGGIYKPGGNNNTVRDLSFAMKAGVAIYGGFEGTETVLSQRPNVNPLAGSPSSSE